LNAHNTSQGPFVASRSKAERWDFSGTQEGRARKLQSVRVLRTIAETPVPTASKDIARRYSDSRKMSPDRLMATVVEVVLRA